MPCVQNMGVSRVGLAEKKKKKKGETRRKAKRNNLVVRRIAKSNKPNRSK
jgi:hypothetical protein